MSNLVLGLYAEGSSDYQFLPPVIGRTAEQILVQHEQNHVEPIVLIIELTKEQKKNHIEGIFQAAIQAFGCHALIIHADADHPTTEKAKSVELYQDPKQVLNEVVRKVHPHRPRLWSKIMRETYVELAPRIRLERLQEVPAYQHFVKDLTNTLKKLNLIH